MNINKYDNILWDWNGTLINDKAICIKAMNTIMRPRNIPELTEEVYLNAFTFPVKDYYQAIGFDFSHEAFEIPAMEFIHHYTKLLPTCNLYPKVAESLQLMKQQGKSQYILSAMQEVDLNKSVKELGISNYFKEVAGIQDHYAKSKIGRGEKLMTTHSINKDRTLLIGDTLHDIEVAEALGVDVVLIGNGHQAVNRLQVNGNTVLTDMSALINNIKG